MSERKFRTGDRVWLFDVNRRRYSVKGGNGSPDYEYSYVSYYVKAIEGRSYLMVWGEDGIAAKCTTPYGFVKAEKLFKTDTEKDDDVTVDRLRNPLCDAIRKADAATLRKVAEVLGMGEKPE